MKFYSWLSLIAVLLSSLWGFVYADTFNPAKQISAAQTAVVQSIANTENLVRNADFENKTDTGALPGWTLSHWNTDQPVSAQADAEVVYQGQYALKLQVTVADDARMEQVIPVQPEQWYQFSAWVKTQNVADDQVGANLSVIDAMEHSQDLRATQDWQQIQVWGKTAAGQTEIKLALRLGFYGAATTGTVWFDQIELKPVDNVPYGAPQMLLTAPPPASSPMTTSGLMMNSAALAIAGVFCLLALTLIWQRLRLSSLKPLHFAGLIVMILAFKLVLAGYFFGYSADVNTFSAWAMDVYQRGPAHFYQSGYFADYPPGYMYLLWCVGALVNQLQLIFPSPVFLMVLKLPAILVDIAIAVWLYRLGRPSLLPKTFFPNPQFMPQPLASLAALLWLLNPLVIFNSSVWGQVDSIFTWVIVLSLVAFDRAQMRRAAAYYALAILLKPQALLLAPLALLMFVRMPNLRLRMQALAVFGLVMVGLVLPFAWNQASPWWIFQLYTGTLGSYPYLTLNAFNFYTLLNANFLALDTQLWGLTVGQWAWCLVILSLAPIACVVARSRKVGSYLWAAAAIMAVFFVFGPKMHERYLFPAALLSLVSWLWLQDKRLLWVAIGFSLTGFLNCWVVLDAMARLNTVNVEKGLMPWVSGVNVALTGYLLWLGWQILIRQQVKPFSMPPTSIKSDFATEQTHTVKLPAFDRKTQIQLLILCGIYALLAFFYLGSPKSPRQPWQPLPGSDAVVLDVGQIQAIPVVEWHHGLGTGEYALAFSVEGKSWQPAQSLKETDRFGEFRWRQVFVNTQARFIRVEPVSGDLRLNEIVLRDAAGQQIKAQKIAGPESGLALIDEQDTAVSASTALNGMYFDEIYHARSAWEMLQGIDASENTHPPLGKLIIAAGISVLGMNPLGFRFMGALFGILMLPIIFAISRRVFYSNRYALMATAFLAVDFMHFTQTRIATIDTYGVFFILASSYYLLRFLQHEPAQQRWRLDRAALLWGGLWFSVGVASKWIVIYAGAGLAALFAWQVGRQYLIARSLQQSDYLGWLAQALVCGLLGFVILPVVVMCLAYWPHLHVTGLGLGEVWKSQIDMWNYHSQMKDSHPYSSQWYEWPLMLKPIWYYVSGQWFAEGQAAGIVAFGNPVVWYLGSIAFVGCGVLAIWQTLKRQLSLALGFIVVSGLAQFLPWALIPRKLVFIYHFFASVPFIILAMVWWLQMAESQRLYSARAANYINYMLLGLAMALFALYYPLISGFSVNKSWSDMLRQLPPLSF